MDDVSKRVFELARGCIDELEKQKQYIQLLEESAKGNQGTTRPECETEHGTDNGAGGNASAEASIDNSNAE